MIVYVSSSCYPSVEANLVHVLNQVWAFKKLRLDVKLVLTSNLSNVEIANSIYENYDLKFELNDFLIYKSKSFKYKEFKNLLVTIKFIFFNFKKINFIISRNLLFSFIYKKNNLITEFHTIYNTKLRFLFQKNILQRKNQKNILISKRLHFYLSKLIKVNNYIVLHDAAEINIMSKNYSISRDALNKYFKQNQYICTYTGSLHEGRGIDIIIQLAKLNPELNFLIIGSNVKSYKNNDNIYFLGYIPYKMIKSYLSASDLLLMPYQNTVSINVKGQDTSKWMSPLKLFEYMSVKKPIISSNLPVIREILKSNYNCKLVKFNSINDWHLNLNFLKNNPVFSEKLAENAYKDYLLNYTWDKRAFEIYKYFNEV